MKKIKTEINVSESDLRVNDVISRGASAPFEEQVAVLSLLEDKIEQLKTVADILKANVKNSSYSGVMKDLKERGRIADIDCSPVIILKTKNGKTSSISFSESEDMGFTISPDIEMGIISESYKRHSITLDRKLIEKHFLAGVLPAEMEPYCSTSPRKIIKTRKTNI